MKPTPLCSERYSAARKLSLGRSCGHGGLVNSREFSRIFEKGRPAAVTAEIVGNACVLLDVQRSGRAHHDSADRVEEAGVRRCDGGLCRGLRTRNRLAPVLARANGLLLG